MRELRIEDEGAKAPDVFLCPNCHHPGPWASPEQVETWKTWEVARGRCQQALAGLVGGSGIASAELTALAPLTGLSESEVQDLRVEAFIGAANQAVSDQILTPEEDASLNRLMVWLGVTWGQVSDLEPSLPAKAIVSSINGGTLPEVTHHVYFRGRARSFTGRFRQI
jgi:hypothetical protein